MTLEEKLEHVRFQVKWYTKEIEKHQLAVDAYRKEETELVKVIEAMKPSFASLGASQSRSYNHGTYEGQD